jgi:CO/xanthine dehydrogenase Mo-binding subunit
MAKSSSPKINHHLSVWLINYYNENQHQLSSDRKLCRSQVAAAFYAVLSKSEMDTETYEYKILHYVSVVDCGTTINSMLAAVKSKAASSKDWAWLALKKSNTAIAESLTDNSFLYYKIPTMLDIDS